MDFEEYDFLYVQDAFCKTFGWYAIDNGTYIYQELAAEIDEFIAKNNYLKENVTSFGSSKGGYGALLHGLLCKNIGTAFSAVPQIDLNTYFCNKNLVSDPRFDDLQHYGKLVTKILPSIEVDSDTKLTLYTGINDGMIKSQIAFISDLQPKLKNEIKVKVRIGNDKHNDLVIKNNKILLNSLKKTIAETEMSDPLFPVFKGSEVTTILSYGELIKVMTENIKASFENQLSYVLIPEFIANYEIAMYFYYSETELYRAKYIKPVNNKFALKEKIKENLLRVSIFIKEGDERSVIDLNI